MNETWNLQLAIILAVSHHPGCHTVSFDSKGWWSTGNIQAQIRNCGAWVSFSLLSRFPWTPPSSPAGITWQHQHWQHWAHRSVTVFAEKGCAQRLKHSLSCSHGAAQQSGTVLWLSHFGDLPRHRARRRHGKTALSSRIWLINATWLWNYTEAFSEFWKAK